MAIRRIIRMGHPTLRRVARHVPAEAIGSAPLKRLIGDMIDTLHDYGGVGLAAPQVDESLRLAIIEIGQAPTRYGDVPELPLTVFINPEITILDPQAAGNWEGCLSVPGLRGFVERPQHIRVAALDETGKQQQLELRGFLATVFQHEFDHLDGKLYIDRMTDSTKLVFESEYLRHHV